MIVVDSSVWIDYFNGTISPATDMLDKILDAEPIVVGDLTLTEVLQGFRNDNHYRKAKELLTSLTIVDMVGQSLAITAADNYRTLRKNGLTIRKTIDIWIATYCIENRLRLLHDDRDFGFIQQHLSLRTVLDNS